MEIVYVNCLCKIPSHNESKNLFYNFNSYDMNLNMI